MRIETTLIPGFYCWNGYTDGNLNLRAPLNGSKSGKNRINSLTYFAKPAPLIDTALLLMLRLMHRCLVGIHYNDESICIRSVVQVL